MASRSAAQQNASTAEQRAQNPAPKTYRCSRFLCAYENPPQVAWGKFQCAAIYGGQRCTGTFEVSPKDAYSWHQTCLEDIARGDAEKEREMERRLAREARIHENEETIWKYQEEIALYEKVFSGDKDFNFSVASYKSQLAAGKTLEEAGEILQRQLRGMKARMKELLDEIARLELENRLEDPVTPPASANRLSTASSFYVVDRDDYTAEE